MDENIKKKVNIYLFGKQMQANLVCFTFLKFYFILLIFYCICGKKLMKDYEL